MCVCGYVGVRMHECVGVWVVSAIRFDEGVHNGPRLTTAFVNLFWLLKLCEGIIET